jgi:hypothetical protein
MEFDTFQRPFKTDGEPARYLRLILPFLETDRATKKEMLKWVGVDLESQPEKRNTHSTTLAKFSRAGILYTKPRGDGYWKRGENFDSFIGWVAKCMIDNKQLKGKFKNLLYKGQTPSIDFIIKD